MSKRRAPRPLRETMESLAATGVTEVALAAGSIPLDRLAHILEEDSEQSAALAALLGKVPLEAHATLLAAAQHDARGTLRRELRHALYCLRRAGIEPPSDPAPQPAAGAASTPAEPTAWLSHIDGRGDRIAWITKSVPTGLLFIYARISDQDGLCDLSATDISKRQFRLQRDELRDRHGLRMAPVPWRHADALLVVAHERTPRRGAVAYPTVRARLTIDPPVDPGSPIREHLSPESVDPRLVDESAELLEVPEMRWWTPTPEQLELYVQEIMEARETPLVLSRHQQDDRLGGIIDRATQALYPAATFAPRLEAMAFYFWQTARERQARIAFALAIALGEKNTPSHRIPLLAALLSRPLAAVYEAARTEAAEAEKESLLVKPGPGLVNE